MRSANAQVEWILRDAAFVWAHHPRAPLFETQLEASETFPEGRALVADYELARKGYRWCPVGNFMLLYTADADTGTVYVERLLYGVRDWKSLL